MKSNIYNLSLSLYNLVYGQHLVRESVPKLLKAHLSNPSPHKPLVLSFHGSTGVGKNLVSTVIAENLYYKGLDSNFVKYIHVPHWFRDPLRTEEQAVQLHQRIISSLDKCKQTLFIFDDIHTMNPKILDELLPYINSPLLLHETELRQAIYIFISNSGADKINSYLTDQLLAGRERHSIGQEEMHDIINERIYRENGAFKETSFVSKHVIDAALPFLPLEKRHVAKCIEKAILARGLVPAPSMVTEVLRDVTFSRGGREVFSRYGCKRIEQIVTDLYSK